MVATNRPCPRYSRDTAEVERRRGHPHTKSKKKVRKTIQKSERGGDREARFGHHEHLHGIMRACERGRRFLSAPCSPGPAPGQCRAMCLSLCDTHTFGMSETLALWALIRCQITQIGPPERFARHDGFVDRSALLAHYHSSIWKRTVIGPLSLTPKPYERGEQEAGSSPPLTSSRPRWHQGWEGHRPPLARTASPRLRGLMGLSVRMRGGGGVCVCNFDRLRVWERGFRVFPKSRELRRMPRGGREFANRKGETAFSSLHPLRRRLTGHRLLRLKAPDIALIGESGSPRRAVRRVLAVREGAGGSDTPSLMQRPEPTAAGSTGP